MASSDRAELIAFIVVLAVVPAGSFTELLARQLVAAEERYLDELDEDVDLRQLDEELEGAGGAPESPAPSATGP